MLNPVTRYNGKFREVITQQYLQRLSKDKFFYDDEQQSFNKQVIIDYGNNAFSNVNEVIDLELNSQSRDDLEKPSWLNKLQNFTLLGEQETEFYFKFKPHNGTKSVRNGFYKLLPIPSRIFNWPMELWQADVLYTEGPNNDKIYKYKCNIGTLVNSLAVVRDLRKKGFYNLREHRKDDMLKGIVGKTIYVSSAELVNHRDFNSQLKEVLWFFWN